MTSSWVKEILIIIIMMINFIFNIIQLLSKQNNKVWIIIEY